MVSGSTIIDSVVLKIVIMSFLKQKKKKIVVVFVVKVIGMVCGRRLYNTSKKNDNFFPACLLVPPYRYFYLNLTKFTHGIQ